MTQAKLSALLSASIFPCYATTIAKIESGDRSVKAEEFIAIADALGASLHDLSGYSSADELTPLDWSEYTRGLHKGLDDSVESLAVMRDAIKQGKSIQITVKEEK